MDKNNEESLSRWVNSHMATLNPSAEWQPNVRQGLEHLKTRRDTGTRRLGTWALAAFAAAAACVCLLIFPTSRTVIHGFWGRNTHLGMVNVGRVSADVKAQSAPDFALSDVTGADIQMSSYRGKVVLLNFWATWCGACEIEIPWLIEFEKEHKDSGFAVIGVSMDADGWKAVKPFLDEKQINYPVVIGNDSIAESYGVVNMPMTLIVSRDGKIAAASVGILDKNACEAEIVRLLQE